MSLDAPTPHGLSFSLLVLPGLHSDVGAGLLQELEEQGYQGEIVRLVRSPRASSDSRQWQPYREYAVGARWSPVRAALFGLCFCQAPCVILASGGIPLSADLVAAMLQAARSRPADVVIASRFAAGAHPRYPLHQMLLSRLFQKASQLAISGRITDPRSGLKLFPREPLLLALGQVAERSADLHLLPLTYFRHARIVEVTAPVRAGDVRYPLSFRVLLNALSDLVRATAHRH